MEDEVDPGLVPVAVPRAEVSSMMPEVPQSAAYWTMEQQQGVLLSSPDPATLGRIVSVSELSRLGPVSVATVSTGSVISAASPGIVRGPAQQQQVTSEQPVQRLLAATGDQQTILQPAPSLQDSRLVGVPTLGRVIPMSELSRMSVPEMRIVLQPEPKLEDDLSILISGSEQTGMVSESTGMLIRPPPPLNDHESFQPELSEKRVVSTIQQTHHRAASSAESLVQPPQPAAVQVRKADKSFPSSILRHFVTEYKTGRQYDAVWECDGGLFKVHRLVLAAVSPLFRQVLGCQPGHVTKAVIYTPGVSAGCVKSLLCLFYTGKVNIVGDLMGEVNAALKMLQFHGDNVTLLPSQSIIKQETEDLVGSFSQVASKKTSTKENCKDEMTADSDEDWDPKTDLAFDDDIQGDEEPEDWWQPQSKKRKTQKADKCEEEEDTKTYTGFRRGRKSLKTPDTDEIYRTRGQGKGERSCQLSLDLFDGRSVDFIHVCHACYKVFDRTKEFTLHKDDSHPEGAERGPHHTEVKNEFLCPKCEKVIRVKHIAWFSKHLKYCRVDNDIANNIVAEDDNISDNEECGIKKKYTKRCGGVGMDSVSMLRDSDERLRITGEAKGKNLQTLSNVLFGKIVDFIWGCKVCYSVFLSEDELETHKEVDHSEGDLVGEHWNPIAENYTCPHCKQIQNSRHLVWFIYHMKKCSINCVPFIKREVNDTEDETDNEEEVKDAFDPDQILLKPYHIVTDRAEWICQSLLGRLVQTLYPCHVCYQVYEAGDMLTQHFRASHKGLPNKVTSGPYYNAESSSFSCPVCAEDVCKNQTSAIKFIYHFKKCSGQVYSFTKSCDECEESFTEFKAYKTHILLHTSNKNFVCHLCTKSFPSNARLNYHVQYVHSSYKPYKCDKCEKSYKRKAELQEHEEMSHSSNFNYSCDKCGKQFYGKKNLALHMKTHYSDDEKKHVCNVCGHRFAKIKFLKNHMTVHSDIRQFACEVCGARVKTRDTLKQHRKKLHNLLTPVPKNAQVSEELLRSVDTGPAPVIIAGGHQLHDQQQPVMIGVNVEEQQRPLVTSISSINTVPALDQRLIGSITNVQTILPKI